jgi:hypothetical protein
VSELVTAAEGAVPPEREQELVDGFRDLVAPPLPDGLLRSELLRGQDGRWRIETRWRDREAIMAVRASGGGPAAQALFESLGVKPSHEFFVVEQTSG